MEEESELELSQPLTDEEFSSLYAYLNGNSSTTEPSDGENQNELLRSRSQSVTDPPTPGYPDTADGRVDTPGSDGRHNRSGSGSGSSSTTGSPLNKQMSLCVDNIMRSLAAAETAIEAEAQAEAEAEAGYEFDAADQDDRISDNRKIYQGRTKGERKTMFRLERFD